MSSPINSSALLVASMSFMFAPLGNGCVGASIVPREVAGIPTTPTEKA